MTFNVMSEGSPSPAAPAAVQQNAELFEFRLLIQGEIADDILKSINEGKDPHQILASQYKSVPEPQFFYVCSAGLNSGSLPNDVYRQIERALALLAPQHAAFVWHAAHTLRGKSRRTSNLRRSHSQGLYSYASNFVRGNWQPAIEQHGDAHSLGRSNWTFQEELPSDEPLVEGASFTVKVNAFERNPLARQECVAHHGTACAVCGFSFACAYGSVAAGYVHVHHLKPLASIGKEYVIDPIKDLRPVCANCHAVIHLRQPPYSIEEVKRMLTDSK
ncbi:MAG: hypothetical protein HYZ17_08375 [Betaproteobacteria bacterium]|nr:hypothetical protein [Betaproteobacteria bacterium]